MRRLVIVLLAVAVALGVFYPRQPSSFSAASVRDNAQRALADFNIPGLAVVVVKDGKVLLAEGFGVRNVQTGERVNADTLFGVASHTKAFTAAAIAQLVEQGQLNWDDRVVQHLPEFALSDRIISDRITVRDLLSHRTGLGLGAGDLMIWPATDKTTTDLLASLKHLPMARDLRQGFAYNNMMFVVAGEVISRVSGMPYADYVQQNLLLPAGMQRSVIGFSKLPSNEQNFAIGHAEIRAEQGDELQPFALDYLEDFAAAGALASSANDFSQWLLTQLNQGKSPTGEELFSPESQRTMWQLTTPLAVSPSMAADGTYFRGAGLGWFVKDFHGVRHISHSGGILGMLSLTTIIPEHDFAITVMSNQQAFDALTAITNEALEQLLELPDQDHFASAQANYRDMMAEKGEFTLAPADGSPPSLAIGQYSGLYHDSWYGDIIIAQHGDDQLTIRFTHSPLLLGMLEHYQGDTFVARWNERLLEADAFVHFDLQDGEVRGARMEAVAPFTDFSFDFHNLELVKR